MTIVAASVRARDAVGNSIVDKARFFQGLGCDVKVFYEDIAEPPTELRHLFWRVRYGNLHRNCAEAEHFHKSAIYVLDYPHYYELAEAIRLAGRGLVFFNYHGVTPPELWGKVSDADLIKRSVEGGRLARHADYAIVHSNFMRQELAQRYEFPSERTFILPLAIDHQRFKTGPASAAVRQRYHLPEGRVLLYVGRMAGNKRIALLVQSLGYLKGDFPDLRLVLVGDKESPPYAPFVAAAQEMATQLGVKSDVVFTGQVSDADLPDFYRLADVFVTASLHEGFGMPVLEAMASGVPVVASRATALPETVGEAGILFEPGDPEDLAAQVRRLLADPTLYQRLVALGLERVAQFTPEAHHRRLMGILMQASALGVRRPPDRMAPLRRLLHVTTGLIRGFSTPGPQREMPLSPAKVDQPMSFDELARRARVLDRAYTVRSDKPLVGPLIAWVRRNITSHLREPYLDPMMDRQEVFNLEVVRVLHQLANQVEEQAANFERQEKALTERLDQLQRELNGWKDELARTSDSAET